MGFKQSTVNIQGDFSSLGSNFSLRYHWCLICVIEDKHGHLMCVSAIWTTCLKINMGT